MLPSFRLVVATFLLSFLLVFASLRLVESSRIAHEPLSGTLAVMPPEGAPLAVAADRWRWDEPMPAVFDLRFAMAAAPPSGIPVSLTLHAIERARGHDIVAQAEPSPDPAPAAAGSEPAIPLPAPEDAATLQAPAPDAASSNSE